MALAVVRALGESGVPVFVARYDRRDIAHASRYVKQAFVVPSPRTQEAELVDALVRLAGAAGGGLLVPASDEAVVAVSRNAERLARHYVVATPAWEVVRTFIEKRRTYELAAQAGVPAPGTVFPCSLEEAKDAAARFGFPLLLKPSQSHLYFERFRRKMMVIRGMAELVVRFEEARDAGLEVMVQDIIPGQDSEVVNYNAYFRQGRPLVEFTARQLRKAPPRFGSPRVVRSERIDAILGPGRTMLRALGFEGFACSEFKRDPRDGRYKIVDVNGRHNLSGLLAVRCGINFPLVEYRHLLYGELPRPTPFPEGVYWTDLVRDAAYGLRYLLNERHAPWAQLAPYVGPGCDGILDRSDLRPFLVRCGSLLRSALGRGRGRGRAAADGAWAADGPPAQRA
jgi:predicted ATP-grasp superfamily ATP-dependent carboligase